MKKVLAITLIFILAFSFSGCQKNIYQETAVSKSEVHSSLDNEQKTSRPEEQAPAVSSVAGGNDATDDVPETSENTISEPEDEPEETFIPIYIYEDSLDKFFEVDMDGDGTSEKLIFRSNDDGYGYSISIAEENSGIEISTDIQQSVFIMIVDLDPLDAYKEILLTGDECSADYVTYCLRFGLGDFHTVKFYDSYSMEYKSYFPGLLLSCNDTTIAVQRQIDLLGTYSGNMQMTYSPVNSVFDPVNSIYVFDYSKMTNKEIWINKSIRTKKELPVYIANNSGLYVESTLAAGTTILLTGTDLDTYVSFITADGTEGFIRDYQFMHGVSDEYEGLIMGKDSAKYFGELPYSG